MATLGVAAVIGLAGCSDSSRTSVSGKVTSAGQPVTGGSITFYPVGGGAKPASADVKSDGTYDLSAAGDVDGGTIGKNRVDYSPPAAAYPEGVEPKPGDKPQDSPFVGLKPVQPEVEVKAGANTVDVELAR